MGDTFSKMAKKYQVTLVAGSTLVSGPNGTVYNASTVFGPDGQVLGSQKKVHLVDDEMESGLDLTPGSLNEIHAIDTPAGRLGIAICYDAFFEDVVDRLASEKAAILVQPSFNPGQWTPEQKSDWKQGTWTAVRTHSNFIAGVNPMMVGSLWDIRPEGQSSIISGSDFDKEDGYLARSVTSDQEEVISSTVFVHN
jgi:predicted amidohydrolase